MSSPRRRTLPSEGLMLKDDFLTNDLVTDNNIGELGWQETAFTNASTLAYQTQTKHGVLRVTTAATADGDGSAFHLFTDGLVISPGTEFGARVRYPVELASLNFRIGLDDSVTAASPGVGVWLDSNAGVLTAQVDSADHGDNEVIINNAASGLTSGTTLVVGEWLDFKVVCSGGVRGTNAEGGPSEVDFYLGSVVGDGHAGMVHVAKVPCLIDNDEEVEPKIAVWQDSGGADAVAFEIDHYWLWIPRSL